MSTTVVERRAIYCDGPECRLRARGKPIGWTNGTEAELYCGSCRRMVWWRVDHT